MTVPFLQQRASVRDIMLRVFLSGGTFVSAFLAYPHAMLVLGTCALALSGAYEVVAAGIILDALLAPGNGMFGDYRYTVLMLFGAFGMYGIRTAIRGSRAG